MDNEEKVFQQDLRNEDKPGMVFMMHLLMKEKCSMPDKDKLIAVMQKHLQDVECFGYDNDVAGFAVKKYKLGENKGNIPPQLMIMGCSEGIADNIDDFRKSQMWDCRQDRDRILSECKYQVTVTDIMAATMEYKDRADMLMDFMEALVEIYPECEAVYFQTSGKMFMAEQIRNHDIPRDKRFIYFAVNVRFFNIQGTEDMLVDTLGMSTLFLPDLQYHFHGMEPGHVINHAYNMLAYIFDNDNPIKDCETIDGLVDGDIRRDVQWQCHYEEALIQPQREVLDVCMDRYASGDREY